VRLVACSNCHTQYDVTEVVAKSFPCRCGETVENQSHEAVDAKIHRCGSCGAIVAADAEGCDFCGSAIERDPGKLSLICPECYARCAEKARFCTACGVGFRPEPVRLEGHELPCPACGALMPPQQIGGVGLNECRGCNGLWVPGESFDLLVSRAIEARRNARPEDLLRLRPRVRGANPASQAVKYRKCPECEGFMQRRNFRKSSGVIIDVCNEHGTWLDADELEQIAGFILSGGHPSKLLTEPPETTGERKAAAAFAAASTRHTLRNTRIDHHQGGVVGSLLETLTRLLS
jgi:Zn-finger nucleic acid-binding protein